ncbi:MAG: hypothetical protein AUJ00_06775 [Gemmatimonadetes bacterium 13_1_40CM_3_70_6]|nr:MAG: hypothetical protein AUJ00_06775 [Gemmatimonadetes bacterium 13_1_40CM_3_70_6]
MAALIRASFDSSMNCGPLNTGIVLAISWNPALVSKVTRLSPTWPRRVVISTTPFAPRAP